MIIISLPSLTTLNARGQSYNLKFDLGFSGTLFAGAVISIISNFTNTGQLTIRVTGVLFTSDFWPNGTRQLTSEVPFNLTAGMNRVVDTPVLIPTSVAIGNHNVTGAATWQYSSGSRWSNATPVIVGKIVLVSQTIGSLFSSFATILLIGLGAGGAVAVSVIFLVTRPGKKSKSGASLPVGPKPNTISLLRLRLP